MNKNKEKNMKRKAGFTLIEMIVVITIIGILGTVLYASYSKYIKSSKEAVCKSELLEIVDTFEYAMIEHQNSGRTTSDDFDETNYVNFVELYSVCQTMIEDGEDADGVLKTLYEYASGEELSDDVELEYQTNSTNGKFFVYTRNGITLKYDVINKEFTTAVDNVND